MQDLQHIQSDSRTTSLDAIGGEPLAGSGFEAEEPEFGFSSTDQVEEGANMANTTSQPRDQQAERPALRDFRQEVTESIIQMLERGVAPWQKPWQPGASSLGIPFNPTSEREYRGGNAIHLMASGLQRGYQDPRWMTYKQAADNGWQVRRGEKGTQIEYWEAKEASNKSRVSASDGDGDSTAANASEGRTEKSRFIHRVYTVFNAQQIDGIPPHNPKQHTTFEAVQAGEQILKHSGASIAHDQADRGFYSRAEAR